MSENNRHLTAQTKKQSQISEGNQTKWVTFLRWINAEQNTVSRSYQVNHSANMGIKNYISKKPVTLKRHHINMAIQL